MNNEELNEEREHWISCIKHIDEQIDCAESEMADLVGERLGFEAELGEKYRRNDEGNYD